MAENLIFQSEKTLEEIGDKLPDSDKADVKIALEKLKESVKTDNSELIKADTDALEQAFYKLSEKLYQQSGAQGGAGAGQGFDPNAAGGNPGGDGNYYNADFEDKTGE